MLSQRIHPGKPYLGMYQGTGGKVDVYLDELGNEFLEIEEDAAMRETLEESALYLEETQLQKIWTESVPSQLEWTARRCEKHEATYNVTLSIFTYPWDKIQEPVRTEPEKATEWKWYTYQEVILMNLIPMLQRNLGFIFHEIEKYFNYCEIESLGENEEAEIQPMTENGFNNFRRKFEQVTDKEIIALELYKKNVTMEVNRLRSRLTRINKYLNNFYGRKYLQIFDFQDRSKVSERLNCNPTLKEIQENIPSEYRKIQKKSYRYEVQETRDKKTITRRLKIRTIKDYLSVDETRIATLDQLALHYPNYQLI